MEERGLAVREGLRLSATAEGEETAAALARAREESLTELLGDWWTPGRPIDLTELMRELNAELRGELSGDESQSPANGAGGADSRAARET